MTPRTIQDVPPLSYNARKSEWGWLQAFVLIQFAFQILLLFPQFGVLRVPMRIGTFGLSLFLTVWLRGRGISHPATEAAIAILTILGLSFCLHPNLNTVLAGLAQCSMYMAILGPLFWVKRLNVTPTGFKQLVFLMWGFHTLSAFFGVLQVYHPGQFQPYLSTAIQAGPYGGEHLLITLADGTQVYRPMGLTDVPGGAATAGFYAVLLGVGISLYYSHLWLQLACYASVAVGLFCIYLSQVRSILVLTVICLICLAGVLAQQGRFGRLTGMAVGVTSLFAVTLIWAIAIGGESTIERFSSLLSERADMVYYENRGLFLQNTIQVLLPQYPLGAGLGRWGTMNTYFGNNSNPLTGAIWVEIQWTGWLLDGGIPLIIAYVFAIYVACRTAWKIATTRLLGDYNLWAGLIFAYNIGGLAITFNYPLFISQSGLEFWLLNATLFAAFSNSHAFLLIKTPPRRLP
jgi:hypothetical protein